MPSLPSLDQYLASQRTHGVDHPLPMRQSWGPRYDEAARSFTAPDQKGVGFFGPMRVSGGTDIAGEYSSADKINGKVTGYPTIYQGMPPAQLGAVMQTIRMNTPQGPQLGPVQLPNIPVPQSIDDAAYAAAKARVNAGRSPFFEQGKDPYPAWSPDQYWEEPRGMPKASTNAAKQAPYGMIDAGNRVVIGSPHGGSVDLSPELKQRVHDVAAKYGAYYEGDGKDKEPLGDTLGNDQYKGSWDDLVAKSVKGYPVEFLSGMFSNVDANGYHKTFADPQRSIFDSILHNQSKARYFKDRDFDAQTLGKFLRHGSEKGNDFVGMSRMPATEENLKKFFGTGEKLMWPDNWQEYPNKFGKLAKKFEERRNAILQSGPPGVYVAGAGHLPELVKGNKNLKMIGGEKAGE